MTEGRNAALVQIDLLSIAAAWLVRASRTKY